MWESFSDVGQECKLLPLHGAGCGLPQPEASESSSHCTLTVGVCQDQADDDFTGTVEEEEEFNRSTPINIDGKDIPGW